MGFWLGHQFAFCVRCVPQGEFSTINSRIVGVAAVLFVAALAMAPSGAVEPAAPPLSEAFPGQGASPRRDPPPPDTLWFGGDDGNGIIIEDGIWDWDTIVSDFVAHGDPCTLHRELPLRTAPTQHGQYADRATSGLRWWLVGRRRDVRQRMRASWGEWSARLDL